MELDILVPPKSGTELLFLDFKVWHHSSPQFVPRYDRPDKNASSLWLGQSHANYVAETTVADEPLLRVFAQQAEVATIGSIRCRLMPGLEALGINSVKS